LDWSEEFSHFTKTGFRPEDENADIYRQEFWKKLENEWIGMAGEGETPWLDENHATYDPFKEYKFTEENPVRNVENPLAEGKRRLEEGDLPSAVLFFEAAVQQQPENAEAWQLLGEIWKLSVSLYFLFWPPGTSQAENEQDPQAISALKKCVNLDAGNLKVWMTLAISFTNELYQAQACHALKMWLQHNPQYSSLLPPSSSSQRESLSFGSSFMSTALHEETTNLFLTAARQRQGDTMDPDIQAGLGVLFNLSGDFEKAVDCFRAAVSAEPTSALLWNRLGATLANNNKSEQAVSAYHKALRYSPGFTRCRYNLGISCINLKAYREAAEHFLTALNFQSQGRGPQDSKDVKTMSESIWNSLRVALNMMERSDLVSHIDSRNLTFLSSEFGIRSS